jgi:hypothetical protein
VRHEAQRRYNCQCQCSRTSRTSHATERFEVFSRILRDTASVVVTSKISVMTYIRYPSVGMRKGFHALLLGMLRSLEFVSEVTQFVIVRLGGAIVLTLQYHDSSN